MLLRLLTVAQRWGDVEELSQEKTTLITSDEVGLLAQWIERQLGQVA